MRGSISIAVLCFLPGIAVAEPRPAPLPPAAKQVVDFDRDVKPILTTHCFACHAGAKQKGGLRLDDAKAAVTGGNTGPAFISGKSADSLLIHLVAGVKPDEMMPPGEAKKLSREQIGVLRAWIDQGAKWGTVTSGNTASAKSNHWSFQPLRKPAVPATLQPAATPIDRFIRAKLDQARLLASPSAEKTTLLRRLHLDLTGLPPTPEEVDAFLKDSSPQAYEQAVDRLLASEHYGERWARHWLDLARYADSDGYEKDTGRPNAFRYRDWVIRALNQNMPYDQFTIEQLAGDLLPSATIEQKTATGFHRNTLTNKEGGVDQEEFRVAAVVDRTNTTTTVWLGLTAGCAQCHDHKYDPISQREYYQLFTFFNSDREVDLPAPRPGEEAKLKDQLAAYESKLKVLQGAVDEAKKMQLPEAEIKKRQATLTAHQKAKPESSKVQTLSAGPTRATHIHIRGDFLRKGVEVKADTPAILPKSEKPLANRLDLARWLVSSDNPLTPRVTANWVWGKLFGRGLVSTPEDFGTQGQKPSHPELLDWLAVALRDDDKWSLKAFIKRIVMSETYRQSSTLRRDFIEKDPLNVFLARQSRLRLEAEIVRDGALAASGLLHKSIGGPSIRPPQPPGISELTYANAAKWVETPGPEKYKRGLYIWFQRTSPYPTLMTFDSTDSNVCVVRRERSNTPLQALTLLNDAVFVEAAQALAKRAYSECKDNGHCLKMEYAFKLALGRDPTQAEIRRMLKLFNDFRQLAKKDEVEAAKLLGKVKFDGVGVAEAAALVGVCRVLLNLDEFVTRE
jgi:mono/diheme cytochrome c family protein